MTHPTHRPFQVDVAELGALVSTLTRAEHTLQDALDALRATGPASIGTSTLDRACQEFQQHWRYGLQQIQQQVGDTAEGVRGVARSYAEAERRTLAALAAAGGLPVAVPAAPGAVR